jgi:hypothetical protein
MDQFKKDVTSLFASDINEAIAKQPIGQDRNFFEDVTKDNLHQRMEEVQEKIYGIEVKTLRQSGERIHSDNPSYNAIVNRTAGINLLQLMIAFREMTRTQQALARQPALAQPDVISRDLAQRLVASGLVASNPEDERVVVMGEWVPPADPLSAGRGTGGAGRYRKSRRKSRRKTRRKSKKKKSSKKRR